MHFITCETCVLQIIDLHNPNKFSRSSLSSLGKGYVILGGDSSFAPLIGMPAKQPNQSSNSIIMHTDY